MDGRWGTVCNNSQEGVARAVCSQLGGPLGGKDKYQHVSPVSIFYCCMLLTQVPLRVLSYMKSVNWPEEHTTVTPTLPV